MTGDREPSAPVSVIVPCFRAAATIERAVLSVAAQTARPTELIVIEDGSDDDTPERLRALQRRFPPGWLRAIFFERNRGVSEARNAGWEAATQPYIALLDADDAWHPRKIEIQHGWMAANPDVALTGHRTVRLRPDQAPPPLPERWRARRLGRTEMLLSNRLPTRSALFRRDLPFRFDSRTPRAKDYLLWLAIIRSGYPAYRLELPLAYSFKPAYGAAGLSADLWGAEKGELDNYRQLRERGLLSRPGYAALVPYSLAKFLVRTLVTAGRRALLPAERSP